jgi:hypothetical protein
MLISVGGSPAKQLEGDEYVFVDQIWATKDHALRISIHINPLSSHLPFYFKLNLRIRMDFNSHQSTFNSCTILTQRNLRTSEDFTSYQSTFNSCSFISQQMSRETASKDFTS